MQENENFILIVDDLPDNQILLLEIIEELGYKYLIAENGKEALEKLLFNPVQLIFMDIEMPVMNGIETTREIRTKYLYPKREVPIVAISAHYYELMTDQFTGAGFSEYLEKPYTIQTIERILEKYCPEK